MTTRASLYQARYGSPDVAVPAAGSTLIDHLLAHRSVRAYLPDPVNDDQLAAIVAAALRVRVFSRRACSSKVKGKDKNHEKAKRGQSGLPRIPQTGSQDTVLTVW